MNFYITCPHLHGIADPTTFVNGRDERLRPPLTSANVLAYMAVKRARALVAFALI